MGEQVDARSNGGVAQLGEHLPCKQGVMSSNLTISTKAMSRAKARDEIKRSFMSLAANYRHSIHCFFEP